MGHTKKRYEAFQHEETRLYQAYVEPIENVVKTIERYVFYWLFVGFESSPIHFYNFVKKISPLGY